MSGTVFIDLDRTGQWFVFCSPYNESFIFELKARIPAKFRRWVAEQKAWCVARNHWPTAEKLLRKHYGHSISFEVGPAAEAAQIDLLVDDVHEPSAHDYMKLGVRADAPHCVLHAAYHALESLWCSTDREVIKRMGVYPIEDIREAYARVCKLRGLDEDPSAFDVAPRTANPNNTPPEPPPVDEPPPLGDDDYYGPGLDAYAQPKPMKFIDFIDEGQDS